jgi:hypothetical protein
MSYAVEVFIRPELATTSEAIALAIWKMIDGSDANPALAALFSIFYAICSATQSDAEIEFEMMIAYYKNRKHATCVAPEMLQ